MMSIKSVRISNLIAAVMLLLYGGCTLLNAFLHLLTGSTGFILPAGFLLCFAVILPGVVLLIHYLHAVKSIQGKPELALSIATLALSGVWLVACLLNWLTSVVRNIVIENYEDMHLEVSLGEVLNQTSYLLTAYKLFTTVVALFLLVAGIISVLRNHQQRWLQIKAELHKFACSGVILVANAVALLDAILGRIMLNQGLDAYRVYTIIATYSIFAIQVLVGLVAVIVLITVGLIVKKQTAPQA